MSERRCPKCGKQTAKHPSGEYVTEEINKARRKTIRQLLCEKLNAMKDRVTK